MHYEFQSHHGGKRTAVFASDEDAARAEAMRKLWGDAPDKVTPNAPKYVGKGLMLVRSWN